MRIERRKRHSDSHSSFRSESESEAECLTFAKRCGPRIAMAMVMASASRFWGGGGRKTEVLE